MGNSINAITQKHIIAWKQNTADKLLKVLSNVFITFGIAVRLRSATLI